MQNKPTELRLNNAEYVVVYVNDMVVGEFALGVWEGDKRLMERVAHARRLEAIPCIFAGLADRLKSIENIEDHINKTSAGKQQAFARGLLHGLDGKSEPSRSFPGIHPDQPPEHTHAYRAGYEYGRVFANIGRMISEANAD